MCKPYSREDLYRDWEEHKKIVWSAVVVRMKQTGQPMAFLTDACNDLFWYLDEKRVKNPPRRSFIKWAKMHVYNFLRSYMRSESGNGEVDHIPDLSIETYGPEFKWPKGMSKDYKEVLIQKYAMGLTIKEIAVKLRKTENQTKSLLKRARMKLRELMNE